MGLDIRIPIGLLFSVFGLILAIFGLFSDPSLYVRHSLGININLVWGLILLCFGLGMLVLVQIGKSSDGLAQNHPVKGKVGLGDIDGQQG